MANKFYLIVERAANGYVVSVQGSREQRRYVVRTKNQVLRFARSMLIEMLDEAESYAQDIDPPRPTTYD